VQNDIDKKLTDFAKRNVMYKKYEMLDDNGIVIELMNPFKKLKINTDLNRAI
jgi:isocitrate dehydrogenase